MAITLNGTTGITTDTGYSGDGVTFADGTPSNTLVTNTSGNVGVGTSSPATKLHVNGSVRLPDGYEVGFGSANSTYWLGDSTNNWHRFYTNNSERMRIDSSGNLLVGTTVTPSSSSSGCSMDDGSIRTSFGSYTGGGTHIYFINGNGTVGTINSSGTNTSYNTSSDYRLKENIAPMTGALTKVSALKPVTYTWKSTGEESQGFIAHELQAVVPDCVTGEKDAVDADGNPVYQGIDTSFLVATLTAAIQEQQAIITEQSLALQDLKARIETLENK